MIDKISLVINGRNITREKYDHLLEILQEKHGFKEWDEICVHYYQPEGEYRQSIDRLIGGLLTYRPYRDEHHIGSALSTTDLHRLESCQADVAHKCKESTRAVTEDFFTFLTWIVRPEKAGKPVEIDSLFKKGIKYLGINV